MSTVIGWDIGGAHLKAARAENGRVLDAVQVPSPLRHGLERLADAFGEAKAAIGSAPRHAVTMTGELADTFPSRQEGVENLALMAVRQLAPDEVLLYAGRAGFIKPDAASKHVADIASANWHASASLVGRLRDAALFVDIGSTTADVVPVVNGRVAARGYTDAERLATGELVYTGLGAQLRHGHRGSRAVRRRVDDPDQRELRQHGRRPSHPRNTARRRRSDGNGRRSRQDRSGIARAPRPHGRTRRRRRGRRAVARACPLVCRSADPRITRRRDARAVAGDACQPAHRSSAPGSGQPLFAKWRVALAAHTSRSAP